MPTTPDRGSPADCLETDTLLAFVERRASPAQRAAVEGHVAECEPCRRLLSALADSSVVSGLTPIVTRRAGRPSAELAPAANAARTEITPAARARLELAATVLAPGPGAAGARAEGASTALEPGDSVGRYRVLGRLGAGGMGVVYAAFDPELERKVALKLLRPELGEGEAPRPFEERLRREAQAMAKLAHPNVVAVHDVGRFGRRVFVAMEFVEGPTLGRWLRLAPRTRQQVLEAFAAAGRGLAAAHAAGLVHRDFKPENVLVGDDGRVRVADFGLARAHAPTEPAGERGEAEPAGGVRAGERGEAEPAGGVGAGERGEAEPAGGVRAGERAEASTTSSVGAGAAPGTPAYMAPEQHRGREADASSDQFSFCVALYEALYGERPFAGDTLGELRAAVMAGRLRPPPRGSNVPGWLRRVLVRGLARSPERRFASMNDLLASLGRDPYRRARHASTALAALGLVAGAALWARPRFEPPCRGGRQRLAGTWSDARREAIAGALRRTGVPFAEPTALEVGRLLDRYAAGWVAQHAEACEATRVRGEQTEELMGLRMACLEDRRFELWALGNRLLEADRDVAQQAVQAASGLSSLEGCADARALSSPVRPPKDATTRAAVDASRAALAEVRALELAGRYREALEQARWVGGRAEALRYRPLEAEAFLAVGELADQTGDYAAAGQALEQASWAAEAGRHDEIAARASGALLRVRGVRQGRYEEVESLARRAEAGLERLGPHDELEGQLRLVLGRVHLEQNRFAEAERDLGRALALFEARYGDGDLRLTETLKTLGTLYSYQGKLPEARAHYERMLGIRRRVLGDDHPETAEALGVVAGVRRLSHEYAEAEALFRQALATLERALGGEHPKVGRVLHDFAVVYESQGRSAEAIALHRRAVAITEKALGVRHPDTAIVLAGLAAALEAEGQLDEALSLLERSLAVLRQHFGDEHHRVVDALLEVGLVHMKRGRLAEARAAVLESRAIGERLSGRGEAPEEVLQTLGDIELRLGRPERALEPLETAFRAESAGDAEPSTLALTKALLGRARFDTKGDRGQALALVREAHGYMKTDARMDDDRAELEGWLRRRGLR